MRKISIRKINILSETEFPWRALAVSILLILLTPFINKWLVILPIAIQIFRMLKYDEHVFIVDAVALLPFSSIFIIPNVGTALGALVVLGDIWFLIKRRFLNLKEPLICLACLAIYLLFRMQTEFTNYIFIVSGLLFMYIMLDRADASDAVWAAKAFVVGLLIASLYGLIFRGNYHIVSYISNDVAASFEYQNVHRFSGILADSNYYSSYLIMGMAIILQLYIINEVSFSRYAVCEIMFSIFGFLTYSRTFFAMFIIVLVVTIYLLFKDKKYMVGGTLLIVVLITGYFALTGKLSAFEVILSRFSSAKNLNQLTTGRSSLFVQYFKHIMESTGTALFGEGLGAGLLNKKGPHNLYIEIMYYVGIVGFILYSAYMLLLISMMKRKRKVRYSFKFSLLGLMAVGMLMIVYLSLQGMKSYSMYIQFFAALLMIILPNKYYAQES